MSNIYQVMQVAAEVALREAEALRRERTSMDCYPLMPSSPIPDYGMSGQVMEGAMAHLRESVPNGQKERTEKAWAALKLAMQAHEQWLRAKGYDV